MHSFFKSGADELTEGSTILVSPSPTALCAFFTGMIPKGLILFKKYIYIWLMLVYACLVYKICVGADFVEFEECVQND